MTTSPLTRTCSHLWMMWLLAIPVACGDDDDGSDDAAETGDTGNDSSGEDPTASDPTGNPTSADSSGTDPSAEDTAESTTDDPDGTDTADDSTTGAGATAQVRVFHLGVNAPAVDVFANGEGPVFSALEFRSSTEYAAVPPGDYTFQVSVSGTPADEAVLAPELTLEADAFYTAVAIGDLEMTDGAPGLQAIALVDDPTGIDAANVRITVVHAAPAVGQVDIWNVTDPENPSPLVENVDFAGSATLPDIPAGPVEVGVDVDDDAQPDLTFSVDTTAAAGLQINAYANNDADGNVALLAQLPDGTVLPIAPN